MPHFDVRVTEIATFARHRIVRWPAGDLPLAAPGQFFLARTPASPVDFLRRPIFPAQAEPAAQTVWLEDGHPLAALEPGDELDLHGPFGRAAPWPERASRLLLAGRALPRLWPLLTWALARGWAVAWLWPDAPEEALDVLPPAVELARGPLTPDLAEWAEAIVLDVPDPSETAREVRRLCPLKPTGAVLAFRLPALPCGFGGCQACWVETRHGRRLACVDGPVVAV